MTDRKVLLEIRPSIPLIIEENSISVAEHFQNKTLRPILKFQNELLIVVFSAQILKRKNVYYQLSKAKRKEYIADNIRKDLKFKNSLIGMVIGHFTQEEWTIYISNEKELSRRITELIIQRLQSQPEKFVQSSLI